MPDFLVRHSTSTVNQPEEYSKEGDHPRPLEHKSAADPYLVSFDVDDPANPKVFFSRQILPL
jgi:hypothetical protein